MGVSEEGFIYILRSTGPLQDNIVKIGFSRDPYERKNQLYTTGVVYPYEIYHAWAVKDMRKAEMIAHERMSDHRIRPNREFFEVILPGYMDSFLSEFGDMMSREEIIQSCLNSMIYLIDTDFHLNHLLSFSVVVRQLSEYSKQRNYSLINPENPNKFAPLFWYLD